MPLNKLIILTHSFPVEPGEEFLIDEIGVTSAYFDEIIICPNSIKRELKAIHKLLKYITYVLDDHKIWGNIGSLIQI